MEIEVQARQLGWVPQEEFRGDASHWVDAETFVQRGQEIMPVLKANNRVLVAKLDATEQMNKVLGADVKELRETIEELTKFQREEVERQVTARIEQLRGEKKAARREEDHDRVDEIEEELDGLNERKAALKAAPPADSPKPNTPAQQQLDPAFVEWAKTRPWVTNDPIKGSLALGIATALRNEGSALLGTDFYNEVEARLDKFYEVRGAKVEGGGPPSGGGGGAGGKTVKYSDLPAEAKAVAERQAAKFVGPNKAFKTLPEWQAHYATLVSE